MSPDGKGPINETRVGETTIDTMSQAPPGRPLGLWIIGGYKLAKATALVVGSVIILRLEPSILLEKVIRLVVRLRLDPDDRLVHLAIARISRLDRRHLEEIGAGLFLYGLLYVIEGVGLLLQRRWAEYLVIVMTSLLIPLEVFEVYRKVSGLRIAVLLVNLLIVAYLSLTIRADRRRQDGGGGRHGTGSALTVPGEPPNSSQDARGP